MSNETYRRFDPWRTARSKRKSANKLSQAIISMWITLRSIHPRSAISSVTWFRRTVETPACVCRHRRRTNPLVEQYRIPPTVGRWKFRRACLPRRAPIDVAARKLREEAGFEAERFSQFSFHQYAKFLQPTYGAVSGHRIDAVRP